MLMKYESTTLSLFYIFAYMHKENKSIVEIDSL